MNKDASRPIAEGEARPGPVDAEVSDAELVRRALDGDEAAFALLYRRHAPLVSRRLRRILLDPHAVSDVLQETFFQVFRNLRRYQPERSFASWLHGFAFKTTGHHLRSQRRRAWLRLLPGAAIDDSVPGEDSPLRHAEHSERVQLFYSALHTLPTQQQYALVLYDLEGMTLEEIGQLLKRSPKTIWANVQTARRKVRAHATRASQPRGGVTAPADPPGSER